MSKKKEDRWERLKHTGIFCTDCGAEQDQFGQIGHAHYCRVLRELVEKENQGGEMERTFLKHHYYGTDGPEFSEEFLKYLEQVLEERRWDAMSDHVLYLQGAKKAIEEIIEELKQV
jgi:hypothetical protein